jgi:Avidin family
MAITASTTVEPPHEVLHPLTGTWHNQLGSRLVITADGAGGLNGDYTSGTGALAGSSYTLVGTYDPNPQTRVTVLGFVVDWTEAHVVTAWSGQYHHDDRTIRATWLMATETEEGDEWKSTFVGHDVFRRDVGVATTAAGVSSIP